MYFEALTHAERETIHRGALTTLAETGLHLPSASRVASRLREAGVEVGRDDRLRLTPQRVETALRCAPHVVRLGARDPRRTAVLDGSRTYTTTDGCGASTLDLESGARRPSVLADLEASARLADALDRYHVYWTMVSAHDVPAEQRVAREYLAALRNTTKPIQLIDVARPEEAAMVARMAGVLRERLGLPDPLVSMLISVVSPLRLDPAGTEAALTFAAAGLPVIACSMPMSSVTAPATALGTVTLAHAEVIGFIAVLQILCPGAPAIYCSFPAFAHPRTGITNYRDPRRGFVAAAATQLGRDMKLPCFASGEESALIARSDLVCFGGLLEVSTLLSFAQMVIDDEILRDMALAAASPEVNAESLALSVIRDVGPGGHYLTQPHTARHIREFVTHRFSAPDRPIEPAAAQATGAAVAGGATAAGAGKADGARAAKPTPDEEALREARRLIGSHSVPALPREVDRALEEIIAGRASL